MADKIYDFEFGISFLSQDENLAKRIFESLSVHKRTYFYKNHEREQTFKDAGDLYSEMFQSKIKFVIIIYREEWGKKGITSIEKDSIQRIQIDEHRGQDYIYLVKMDDSKPTWIGGNKIYLKYAEDKFIS